jgi:hypothetical protein
MFLRGLFDEGIQFRAAPDVQLSEPLTYPGLLLLVDVRVQVTGLDFLYQGI